VIHDVLVFDISAKHGCGLSSPTQSAARDLLRMSTLWSREAKVEEITGLEAGDVLVGAALAAMLPLGAVALARFARARRRPRLGFACYWLLLLYSAGLITSSVVNLTLIGSSGFWLAVGGAGAVGVLVSFARGPALWRGQRDAEEHVVGARGRGRSGEVALMRRWDSARLALHRSRFATRAQPHRRAAPTP
jgi:hypothetical protein